MTALFQSQAGPVWPPSCIIHQYWHYFSNELADTHTSTDTSTDTTTVTIIDMSTDTTNYTSTDTSTDNTTVTSTDTFTDTTNDTTSENDWGIGEFLAPQLLRFGIDSVWRFWTKGWLN